MGLYVVSDQYQVLLDGCIFFGRALCIGNIAKTGLIQINFALKMALAGPHL